MAPSATFLAIAASLLLLLLLPLPTSAATPENEKLILLRLKSYWNDPPSLSQWSNTSSTPHCSWHGVSCAFGQVTNITLRSQPDIDGGIPPSVCDLANLTVLDLYNNSIRFPLPFLSACVSLLHLDLGQNYLNGSLPSDIDTKLPAGLVFLNLGGNEITGAIPSSIGNFSALRSLSLDNNYFASFPPEIGKLSNLERLTLASNPFQPAPLPRDFEALKKLRYVWISIANLTGGVPDWLGTFDQLEHLDLAMNNLTGTIPTSIWQLTSLKNLYLYKNRLSGPIPAAIGASGLVEIDISMNNLSGSIPEDFSKLQNLEILFMYYNNLTGSIPAGISRLANLSDIRLFGNRLTGTLPADLGKYSDLYNLEVTENRISGEIPAALCANGKLQFLAMYSNNFTGTIPGSLAGCRTLQRIMFQQNHLTGDLPAGLWGLPDLNTVMLGGNDLSGELPERLPWNLTRLELTNNRFSGHLPKSAGNLRILHASGNAFSGDLPSDFTGIANLEVILLDGNMISGGIPPKINQLKQLTTLNLSRNQLTGPIPETIGSLPVLTYLDLSVNHLSGEIPGSFDQLKLNSLNLSINSLTGPIPPSLQVSVFDQSFLDNPGLCSGSSNSLTGLPACSYRTGNTGGLSKELFVLIVTLATVVVLAVTGFAFFALRDLRRQGRSGSKWKMTTFQYVGFTESSLLQGLVPENRVGSGGAGEVYRVVVGDRPGDVVAVKKIWSSKRGKARLEKEFLAEVDILGSIRHANIVKLLCCISGEDSKMLVYEYMENGNLHRWLHAKQPGERLDWPVRVDIAIGAARGLCYMHHDCDPPVVHWDVKSSNILLDADFQPKVADFGLARILANGIGEGNSVSNVAGSFGYMAPECAYSSKVNEKIDVYSFGVVLLELTTGKQAHGGDCYTSLVDWAWDHFQKGGSIADAVDEDIDSPLWIEDITTVMRLGLLCTGTLPSTRPSMKHVLAVLHRCASHGDSGDKGVWADDAVPDQLMEKVGGRGRKVRFAKDGGKEDRLVLIASNV